VKRAVDLSHGGFESEELYLFHGHIHTFQTAKYPRSSSAPS